MKYKFLNKLVITSVFIFSCVINSATAGLITIGALTSNDDGSTEVITDSLNNLEWLRWDVYADLTYAQTVVQSSALGFTIASADDANLFLDALYGGASHGCSSNSRVDTACFDNGSFSSAHYTALLGDSSTRGTSSVDAAWFYSEEIGSAGFLNLESGTVNSKFNTFGNILLTDTYAGPDNNSIGWLMYRSTAVPEPRTLAIFALGVIGLSFRRFKK